MTQSDYERLLVQMCEHSGVQDVARLHQTGLLRVGGHDLLLQVDAMAAPGILQGRLDMGMADQDQREWIWYRLLVSNFEWGGYGILGFSLTPDDNHVILTAQYPFDAHTTGAALAGWLRSLVACADAYWAALPSQRPVADIQSLTPLQRVTLPARPDAIDWKILVATFCDHIGLAEREYLLNDADTLSVDGVDMLLRHGKTAPDRFEVRIDLGMETTLPREKLWQGLLWNNFVMSAGGRVLLSVHPVRDTVLLTLQQDLPVEAMAEDFSGLLHALAGSAKTFWIEAHSGLSRGEAVLQKNKHIF
ncbi:hypothetical protein ACVBEF_02715 [Glaciimonas sp. GG7]